MMKNLNCPLCHEKVYSGIGEGCKLCGMPLEYEGDEFCSNICEKIYKTQIHKVNKSRRLQNNII